MSSGWVATRIIGTHDKASARAISRFFRNVALGQQPAQARQALRREMALTTAKDPLLQRGPSTDPRAQAASRAQTVAADHKVAFSQNVKPAGKAYLVVNERARAEGHASGRFRPGMRSNSDLNLL